MIHPACGHTAKVLETREVDIKVRRRYACSNCGVRFTTFESIDAPVPESALVFRDQVDTAIQLLQLARKELLG